MTAIWPAGPPKVCSEMPNQVRTAVPKGTIACTRGRSAAGWSTDGAVLGGRGSSGGGAWRVIGSRSPLRRCPLPLGRAEQAQAVEGHQDGGPLVSGDTEGEGQVSDQVPGHQRGDHGGGEDQVLHDQPARAAGQ